MGSRMSTSSSGGSVTIIGGGIIGLSIGWQLLKSAYSVIIVDAAKPKASLVAAGMVAPHAEALYEQSPLYEVSLQSSSLYPHFLQELKEDSGEEVLLERCGTLFVALDSDDKRWLERHRHFAQQKGGEVHPLTGEQVREKEPLLSPRVQYGVWTPSDAYLDAKHLLGALQKAFLALGGEFVHGDIESLPKQGKVVVAAGAWSSKFDLPIRPLKGEILTVKSERSLKCMVRTPRVYLTPGSHRTIRVGATSEERGYELYARVESMRTLLQEAWEVFPSIDDASILSLEVGLRPLTPDRKLLIGRKEGTNIFYGTGHGRGGILLAPYTAYTIKEALCASYSMVK